MQVDKQFQDKRTSKSLYSPTSGTLFQEHLAIQAEITMSKLCSTMEIDTQSDDANAPPKKGYD